MKQFISTFLVSSLLVALVNSATVDIASSQLTNQPKDLSVPELIASKLPPLLQKHQINSTSRLVDLKPAAANITNLTQCYETGIVGKDITLNIFNKTIEDSIYYYFVSVASAIQ